MISTESWIDIRLVESILLQSLEEEGDRRSIRDVHGSLLGAIPTSEEAANASEAIDNNGTRIAIVRKGARLGVIREDAPFF